MQSDHSGPSDHPGDSIHSGESNHSPRSRRSSRLGRFLHNSPAITLASLTRLLYTHNPFYLASALLVLVGLDKAFAADRTLTGGWLLTAMLCGYTLLLVLAGFLIVRCGRVWEDARTILLVIVLLFLALSVSFDRIVLDSPRDGARFLSFGLGFAIFVSEGIFRGLKIRLAARYRAPYYLVLALLFTYPLVLGQLSVDGHDKAMSWGVFLFPVAAGAVLLTLWPAAHVRGADEPANGTPWPWPWFPWTLFAFLLLAISLRSYSLGMAFETYKGSAVSFQAYFLSPLALVASLLLLEMAIANGSRRARIAAMWLPIAMLLASLPGTHLNPVAARFLARLMETAGSPAQLALAALVAFYALAWLRGLRSGEIGLVACLALAALVDRHTVDLTTLSALQPWPLAAVAALELPLGLRRRSRWRLVVGLAAAVSAVQSSAWSSALSSLLPSALSPAVPPAPPGLSPQAVYILAHACVVLLLTVGAMYDDRWARAFRRFTLPMIPAAAFVAATAYEFLFPRIPRIDHAIYLAALGAVAVLYWRRRPGMPQLLAGLTCACSLVILGSRGLYLELQSSPLRRGLPWLATGLAAFAVALLLSLTKGGLLTRGWRALQLFAKNA